MARYVNRVEVGNPGAFTGEITAYMQKEGFKLEIFNNETVWKKGDGALIMARCVLVLFEPNAIVFNAFTYDAMLGEGGLTGFVGMFPKKKLKKIVDTLADNIRKKAQDGPAAQ